MIHEAVFEACMQDMDAELEPTADAAHAVGLSVASLGWDASTTEAMDWDDWLNELVHRFDPTWTSWKHDIEELRMLWPIADIGKLLDVHHRWRERYDRLCGAYRRAGEIADLSVLPAAEHLQALAYVEHMDRLWSGAWWWRGWLGKYIHHRSKLIGA